MPRKHLTIRQFLPIIQGAIVFTIGLAVIIGAAEFLKTNQVNNERIVTPLGEEAPDAYALTLTSFDQIAFSDASSGSISTPTGGAIGITAFISERNRWLFRH